MRKEKGVVLFPEDAAEKIELDVSGVRVPMRFSRAKQVQRTPRGWKTSCERCGTVLKFDRNTIETSGPANKPNLLKEVTVGYKIVKETNNLADDVEKGRIDWIQFLRRHRGIIYDSARFSSALQGNMNLKLACDHCGSETRINLDIGGTIEELKKLPTDVDALISLGITKKESKQFFQLRTGKLADKFAEAVRFSQKEIEKLQDIEEKLKEFCNNIETNSDSRIVSETLSEIASKAHSIVLQKTKELQEWQKAAVSEVERQMFPIGGD